MAPIGPWHEHPKLKEVGLFSLHNIVKGVKGVGWKMLTAAGMTPADVNKLVDEVLLEAKKRQNHTYAWV